jgi:outer membrane receptor protein involved in Fe transport
LEQYEGAPNPSVGYIIDDIDLSGIGGVTTTFDLEQVDVLRGPQSARYGGSALAGVIYAQSAMPTEELASLIEVTGGSEDTFSAGAAVGGPMAKNVAGRASLYYYEDNGFRYNEYFGSDDTNSRAELTARGKLAWDIGAGWQMLLSGLYTDFDNNYDAWSLDNTRVTSSDKRTPAVAVSDPALSVSAFSDLGKDTQETLAASIKFSGPISTNVDLVSITAAANSDIVFSFDADWANDTTFISDVPLIADYAVAYGSMSQRERDTVSQEFRVVSRPGGRLFNASTDWIAGVYAQRLTEEDNLHDPGNYVDFDAFSCPLPGCSGLRIVDSDYSADTFAVFAATESSLTDNWQLSLGLRVERWDADYQDRWFDNNLYDADFNPVPVDGENKFSPSENMVGGHAALSYAWSDDLRVYARVARGFKAGGFNPSLAAFVDAGVTGPFGGELITYDPEYMWNYELGLKGLWLDGLAQAELSVFYMDREDAQLSQSAQLDNPASFVYVTSNGAATSYGLEASGSWQLSEAWQLHGALGLLGSEIEEWVVRPAVEGRALAHAPPYTLNLGATWKAPAGWFARIDINAVGSYYFDISHDQKSDPYQVVNLRVGKDWANWGVSLWGRNIFDKDYATRGFYFTNEPPYTQDPVLYTRLGEPRIYGLTVDFRYQ